MNRKKLKIVFSKLLDDPEFQKISRRILNKTGRLKDKDFEKRFSI